MKCGKITVAGNDLRTCFWVAFGREGAVVFVQDETSSPFAEQTRKIRAAVEKHVKDD